ncbi:MAG TPA: hypothetical protein VMW05_08820 [Methyloceanibacter sp.]|nr:hypothetical protein [Methyloceanibacter sp.]
MIDKFAKASAIIAAVATLGFAGNAVAQEQTEEEVQTRPNPEESSSSQPGTGNERKGIIVEEQPPQVNPATQGLVRKGFNPQPEPPEKNGSETMRKPDPTLNTQKLDTLKNSPNMQK